MRYILVVGIGVFLLAACSNRYKISTVASVNVADYNMYVFRLCEKIKVEGTTRFILCDQGCEPDDILANKDIQVREELYVLVAKQGNSVIYLTTKTDRSFDLTPDIFNTEAHKDYIFASDIENIYFGVVANNNMVFTNKNETLTFDLLPQSATACDFVIATLLSKTKDDTPINNRLVTLDAVYSEPIRFVASKRNLVMHVKKADTLETIKTIDLTGKQVLFNTGTNYISRSQRRRLKYHPEFD
ncbi:hypothetical protein [Lacinutrix chionoecetis]